MTSGGTSGGTTTSGRAPTNGGSANPRKPAGDGMVSIKDVAKAAGVSVATVSNALNRPERVSVDTRSRVLSVVDELGYVRSESARQLRAGHSRIVALLVLDIGNPFFVDVARGVEDTVRERGLGVMLCSSWQDESAEALYLSLFAEQRVRGVLV